MVALGSRKSTGLGPHQVNDKPTNPNLIIRERTEKSIADALHAGLEDPRGHDGHENAAHNLLCAVSKAGVYGSHAAVFLKGLKARYTLCPLRGESAHSGYHAVCKSSHFARQP